MNNEYGKEVRAVFLETVEEIGTDCDVAGEQRKAIRSEDKNGVVSFAFADEFAIKPGDSIREIATESYFAVLGTRSLSAAGQFHYFQVRVDYTS